MGHEVEMTKDGEYVEIDMFMRFPDGRVRSFEFTKVRDVKLGAVVEKPYVDEVYSDKSILPIAKFYGPDKIVGVEVSFQSVEDDGKYVKIIDRAAPNSGVDTVASGV